MCMQLVVKTNNLGAVYMGGWTGRLPGWDVKQDLAMHVYTVSLICPVPFIWKEFCQDVLHSVPAKRDNFYHINTPPHFAWTILC